MTASRSSRLQDPDFLVRAAAHRTVGDALHTAAGDEWAAVCWFYSAYHLMRHGVSRSPVFDSFESAAALNADLIPDDRHTGRHRARGRGPAGKREWGVNELVLLLFGQVASKPYVRLHEGSIEVRYQSGINDPRALTALKADLATVWSLHEAGQLLRATVAPSP